MRQRRVWHHIHHIILAGALLGCGGCGGWVVGVGCVVLCRVVVMLVKTVPGMGKVLEY